MSGLPEGGATAPQVRAPWWWDFFFGPAVPVVSPGRSEPTRGSEPVVVPGPGEMPGVGPFGPDPGFESEPEDWEDEALSLRVPRLHRPMNVAPIPAPETETPTEPARGGLTDGARGVFTAVILIILLFFFAVTTMTSIQGF